MKTKVVFFTLFFCFFSFSSFYASASSDPTHDQMTKEEYQLALDVLKERVENLKEAKNEATTPAEKEALREEIKDVKKETRELKQQAMSGGIYIGGGALIVILLLLLLL